MVISIHAWYLVLLAFVFSGTLYSKKISKPCMGSMGGVGTFSQAL